MGAAVGFSWGGVAAAVVLADLVSGVVHWMEDAYARVKPHRKLALINKIAAENDLHHRRPRDFLARSWWASSWDLVLLSAAVVAIAWATGHLSVAVLLFAVLSANANQIHKWAHRNPRENPWWVTLLQRLRVLQTPRHHGSHHRGEKNSHYCVITNVLNPVLERLAFWRGLERVVLHLTGRQAGTK